MVNMCGQRTNRVWDSSRHSSLSVTRSHRASQDERVVQIEPPPEDISSAPPPLPPTPPLPQHHIHRKNLDLNTLHVPYRFSAEEAKLQSQLSLLRSIRNASGGRSTLMMTDEELREVTGQEVRGSGQTSPSLSSNGSARTETVWSVSAGKSDGKSDVSGVNADIEGEVQEVNFRRTPRVSVTSVEGEEVECVESGQVEVEVEVHVSQPVTSADRDGGVDTERDGRDGWEVKEGLETGDTGVPGNAESAETQGQSEDADVRDELDWFPWEGRKVSLSVSEDSDSLRVRRGSGSDRRKSSIFIEDIDLLWEKRESIEEPDQPPQAQRVRTSGKKAGGQPSQGVRVVRDSTEVQETDLYWPSQRTKGEGISSSPKVSSDEFVSGGVEKKHHLPALQLTRDSISEHMIAELKENESPPLQGKANELKKTLQQRRLEMYSWSEGDSGLLSTNGGGTTRVHLDTGTGASGGSARRLDRKKLRAFVEETRTVSNVASVLPSLQERSGMIPEGEVLRVERVDGEAVEEGTALDFADVPVIELSDADQDDVVHTQDQVDVSADWNIDSLHWNVDEEFELSENQNSDHTH